NPVLPITPTKSSPPTSNHSLPPSDLPTSVMPGAFPSSRHTSPIAGSKTPNTYSQSSYSASAFAHTPPANASHSSTPNSRSPKRPGSLRQLLSFKNSSRSVSGLIDPASQYVVNSPHTDKLRPASPGASSLASSLRSNLGRRKSGSFWTRRKSSLGMYSDGTTTSQVQNAGGAGGASNGHDIVHQDDGELKTSGRNVGSGEYEPPTLRKRKSVTFWKRKSSMGMNGENVYHVQKAVNEIGNVMGNGNEGFAAEKHELHDDYDDDEDDEDEDDDVLEIEREDPRPRSPPPIIPEIDGIRDGGYIGGEELFKHIG
ncbi:hypothetical protein MMC29_007073, partial [Sticta canariensis]|nr:hypothetical protein [Sticta canariensis]